MDSKGNGYVFWKNSLYSGILTKRFDKLTQSWSETYEIKTDETSSNVSYQVILDANDDLVLINQQVNESSYSLFSHRYNTTLQAWEDAKLIKNNLMGTANFDLVLDSKDTVSLVWNEDNGISKMLWSSRYTSGNEHWDEAQLISLDTNSKLEKVVIDSKGNVFVASSRNLDDQYSIWVYRYAINSNSWDSSQLIQDNITPSYQGLDIKLVINKQSYAFLSWAKEGQGLWFSEYNPINNSWSAVQEIEGASNNSYQHLTEMDFNGNVILVWFSSVPFTRTYNVFDKTWSDIESQPNEIPFNSETVYTENTGLSELKIDHLGNAMLISTLYAVAPGSTASSNFSAWRYNSKTGWDDSRQLLGNIESDYFNLSVKVIVDSSGNISAVWLNDNSGFEINRFK